MREEFAKQEFDEDKLKQDLGLDSLYGEEGFSFVERVGARPTLELNGVYGGFQGEGARRSFRRKPMPKLHAAWWPTRIRKRSSTRLKHTCMPTPGRFEDYV